MLRVTLGHTGSPLQPPKLTSAGYIAIIVGTALRVIFPGWLPEGSSWAIGLAGGLWVLGNGIYFFLLWANPDGRLS